MLLSIIIPYFNTRKYTDELLDCLAPQIREDTEVILIDDGSREPYATDYSWCNVIRQKNKGVSSARNHGLELAHGEYIVFIDSDDIVSEHYIETIRSKMPFDYLDMSWKSLPGGTQYEYKLNTQSDRLKNPSAVTRAFNRSVIGTIRFNENKQAAEDAQFIQDVCKPDMRVAVVTEFLYYYRTYTPNSLSKRFLNGDTDTKRIIYHYDHIDASMVEILDEIKAENEHHEVYVMTNQCDIPEIANYAKVMKPGKVRGMELRGEPLPQFIQIMPPPTVDIVIYTSQREINGIATWIYSFCAQMCDKYEITVLHEGINQSIIDRLSKVAYVKRAGDPIRCKTLLMMKIKDAIPSCVRYEKAIQILHSTRLSKDWKLPDDRDSIIPISDVVKESWKISDKPIHNMTFGATATLHLLSATRMKTSEKGRDRMRTLCGMFKKANIPFQWDCYSDVSPDIKGITHHHMIADIRPLIRNATYLVQLSDEEGFCYSIIEALEEGTPIISTPLKILSELGINDNEHGHIIPYDMDFDVNILLNVPKVAYTYNNEPIKQQWYKVLGKGEGNKPITIKCIKRYRDMQLDRYVEINEVLTLNKRRAFEIIDSGFAMEV